MRLEYLVRGIGFLELMRMCSLCIELSTADSFDCCITVSNLVNSFSIFGLAGLIVVRAKIRVGANRGLPCAKLA